LPIIYHGQIIGVLCLFNREGGPFDRADQTLLSTALEMIAVAVGNARLHTHTITLMKERERLQRQFLQAERLATVGRLTASLSHEINNPMQAIRGALSLALEEVNDPQEVTSYLELCLTESERVVKLIHHLRQIYRPPQERIEALDINRLLEDVVLLAQKELKRQKVQLKIDLSAKLPRMTAIASQLQLVFLNLLLNLSDRLSSADGAELRLSSRYRALTGTILIEFATDQTIMAMAEWMNVFQTASAEGGEELSFGLSLSQDILLAHAGKISFEQREQDLICRIELQQSALF
jgi:nitrogen-specific signal transduction histidine kinase